MSRDGFGRLLGLGLAALLTVLSAASALAADPQLQFTFGQEQPYGPGVFDYNSGIGVDSATGHVYVTDKINLQKYDRDGNFITLWGCSGCFGVDVNPNTGEVYAASANTDRVFRYSSSGALLAEYGVSGSDPGQFRYPYDVTVDPSTNNFWVIDGQNARVQQFDADGNFLAQWGSEGTADGQFSGRRNPYGISFDPLSRSIWVSDAFSFTIQKFDEAGNFLLRRTTTGLPCGCQGDDQLRWIRGISVGPNGLLFVSDSDSERITVWTPDLQLVTAFQGPHDTNAGPFHPRAVAVDLNSGEVYAAAAYAQRVDKFDANFVYVSSWGDRDPDGSNLWRPSGIAVSPMTGDVYVMDTRHFKVKRFSASGAFLNQWGHAQQLIKGETPPGGLFGFDNSGLVVDPEGDVWVVNPYNHYLGDPSVLFVQHFDSMGVFKAGWPVPDVRETGRLRGGAIDPVSRRVFVADERENEVKIYDAEGNLLDAIAVNDPAGIAIHANHLYVVMATEEVLRKYSISGTPTLVAEWDGGANPFKFDPYSAVAVDGAGRVYLADTMNHRVQIFDAGGTLLSMFGSRGRADGQFRNPEGIAVNPVNGMLYVLDTQNSRVQAYQTSFPPACGDGLDNDADGLVDTDDPGCPDTTRLLEDPACDDGTDNDGDLRVDWDGGGVGAPDLECVMVPWSSRETRRNCGLGFELVALLPLLAGVRARRQRQRRA